MLSILKKRQAQQRKHAKKAGDSQPVAVIGASSAGLTLAEKPWDEIQALLKKDLEYVRTLAGSQEKAPFKAELVKKYQPVVERLLATHDNLENLDVIWWFYQWLIDLGYLADVHDSFRAAIERGLETPSSWKVNGQTGYCDIVFKYSHKAHEQQQEFKRDYLIQAVRDLQTGKLATNAPLKVKMYRLVGDWHYDDDEKELAYTMYEMVMELAPSNGGRKIRLNELKEELGYVESN
ncbi:MAG: phage terminase small subunit [Vibrio sp.]